MWCDSAEPDRIKMWKKAGFNKAKGVDKGGSSGSVKAQIDWLKGVVAKDKAVKRMIYVHPHCVNTIKELQQWKWKKDEKTGEYLDEPVPFQDDAMAMLRYSIEMERRSKPKLNRSITGGL
jgi:phage terminase large subunit